MVETEVHKKNKKKNYIVLAIIIVFIAVFWAVTMIKVANAEEANATPNSPFEDIIFGAIEPAAKSADPVVSAAPEMPVKPVVPKVRDVPTQIYKPSLNQPQQAFRASMVKETEFLKDGQIPGFQTNDYNIADIPVANERAPFANRRFDDSVDMMPKAAPVDRAARLPARFERKGLDEKLVPIVK